MNTYSRIFGSGPLGITISLVLLLAAYVTAQVWPWEPFLPRPIRWAVLVAGLMGLIILVAWSLRSLPPRARGVRLQTSGAFRFVRHPLYAAFLSFFNFAFALFLGHPAYLAWAILLHPAWHLIVRHEEALMREAFGERYQRYARVTGRFFPRLRRSGTASPEALN